jgi:predicted DNA-binding antitoxin AbrB/MazE fold protein
MGTRLRAVYKDGVLRPLDSLSLEEAKQVTVTIEEPGAGEEDISSYFSADEWDAAQHDDITIDEVRAASAGMKGSLSDAVISLRDER